MNDEQREAIEWAAQLASNHARPITGESLMQRREKALRALLADGGNGEAVEVAEVVDLHAHFPACAVVPCFPIGTKLYAAPQAECAPRASYGSGMIDAMEDFAPVPAPREAQPVYLVSSEGRFWQIVSEPVWINWQADYRNVLYTAPREAQPDGWKLMPMIPTVEMTVAALAVTDSPCTAYALFLDAAPTPERTDAEKDAERLDWVEKVKPIIFHPSWEGDRWEIEPDPCSDNAFTGATFRDAIDAALAKKEGA